MVEKRMTAAELRASQEGREKAAREAEEAAREEAHRTQREVEQAALLASVENLKASWYQSVLAASQKDGVRFVAIARVTPDPNRLPALRDLVREIERDGYSCEFSSINLPPGRRGVGHLPPDEECAVEAGALKGWKPAGVPKFGSSAPALGVEYLIVKWA